MSVIGDRILLATDGSPEAESAAGMAVTLSEKLGSGLHVVCVEPMPDPLSWPESRVVAPELGGDIRERAEDRGPQEAGRRNGEDKEDGRRGLRGARRGGPTGHGDRTRRRGAGCRACRRGQPGDRSRQACRDGQRLRFRGPSRPLLGPRRAGPRWRRQSSRPDPARRRRLRCRPRSRPRCGRDLGLHGLEAARRVRDAGGRASVRSPPLLRRDKGLRPRAGRRTTSGRFSTSVWRG